MQKLIITLLLSVLLLTVKAQNSIGSLEESTTIYTINVPQEELVADRVMITNLDGLSCVKKIVNNQIDIRDFQKGTYIISIPTKKGIVRQEFVVS